MSTLNPATKPEPTPTTTNDTHPVHVDPAPSPSPPAPAPPQPEQPKHTVKKFRIIVHGEIDVDFDPKTDEEALKEATIKEIKQKIPDFIITRVLISESAGPIGNLT
jgi:hypothetical protein